MIFFIGHWNIQKTHISKGEKQMNWQMSVMWILPNVCERTFAFPQTEFDIKKLVCWILLQILLFRQWGVEFTCIMNFRG